MPDEQYNNGIKKKPKVVIGGRNVYTWKLHAAPMVLIETAVCCA